MSKYYSLFTNSLVGLSLAFGFFYWGWINEGYLRIILSLFIVLVTARSGIRRLKYLLELERWIRNNKNSFVLFYPTKKDVQNSIKEKLIPNIDFKFKEVFYDGPMIVGNIKMSVVVELMDWKTDPKVNEPSMFYIRRSSIHILTLNELEKINNEGFSIEHSLAKIQNFKISHTKAT